MGRKRAATVIAAFVGVAGMTAALAPPVMAAWPQNVQVPAQVTATEPSFTVENFIHPGADILGPERKIVLKDGNSNIQWVPCVATDETQIEIDHWVDSPQGEMTQTDCFKINGTPGWLKMEITGSFGIDAGFSDTVVTTVLDGKTESRSVEATCRSTVRGQTDKASVVELKVNYTGTEQDTDCTAPVKVVTP
ncbi:hypothetical protein [Arthrobacter sp. M2012083]|uniref:hypothetical protein n=1 Tax=Arthrobacter sp. M2012083 TaxID=1197706 RepID=UPI000376BE79|nr:hypothetical protein [Arthrobacter sp. M2012083]